MAKPAAAPVIASPAPAPEDASWLTRLRLLVVLAAVLALTLSLGAWYAVSQLSARDAAIAEFQQTVGHLSAANQDFQALVAELMAQRETLIWERDGLARVRDALAAQRDGLTAERDGLRKERDGLTTQVAELQKRLEEFQAKVGSMEQTLAEKDRQLSQARAEGSRQQSRAQNAETMGAALRQVIQLDDEIHKEFNIFLGHIYAMYQAYARRDYLNGDRAYLRAEASAGRLDALFTRRNQALALLR